MKFVSLKINGNSIIIWVRISKDNEKDYHLPDQTVTLFLLLMICSG